MNRAYSFILLVFFYSGATSAQSLQLEVIQLQNRTAQDVIPVLQPLVAEGGTVTGLNNQLIVKTTPANLEEIKQILQTIDKAARRLVIYVRQDIDSQRERNENALSGRYESGDITISSSDERGRRGNAPGTSVRLGDEDGSNITYRNLNTRSVNNDENLFHVQTLEGKAAFIQTGESVPFANPQTIITHGGLVVTDTVEYRDVNSGFYVVPRLSGNNVTLLISPQLASLDRRDGGIINVQNAETTVSGHLGEWISVGGIDRNSNRNDRRNLTSTRSVNQENRSIQLKVVELP